MFIIYVFAGVLFNGAQRVAAKRIKGKTFEQHV